MRTAKLRRTCEAGASVCRIPGGEQERGEGSAKQDSEAKSGGVRDEITTAIEKIKQMDPEMLANIARAFLKPKEATG